MGKDRRVEIKLNDDKERMPDLWGSVHFTKEKSAHIISLSRKEAEDLYMKLSIRLGYTRGEFSEETREVDALKEGL